MNGWRFEQRKREALARAARRGTLHTVQTPQGPLRADSPTISHLAKQINTQERGAVRERRDSLLASFVGYAQDRLGDAFTAPPYMVPRE